MNSNVTSSSTTTDPINGLYSIQAITVAWLTTSSSNIFLMQLGFLAFESGSVHEVWAKSIIFKNIEDTFVVC